MGSVEAADSEGISPHRSDAVICTSGRTRKHLQGFKAKPNPPLYLYLQGREQNTTMLIPCTQKWDRSQLMPFIWPEVCSSPDCVQGQPGTASLLCAAKGNAHSPSILLAGIHFFCIHFFHKFCLVCIGKMDILYQYHSDATKERTTSGSSYCLEKL